MRLTDRTIAVWTGDDPGDAGSELLAEILTDVTEAAALDFIARARAADPGLVAEILPYVTIDGSTVADSLGPTACTRAVVAGVGDAALLGRVEGWPESDPADHPASVDREGF